MRLRLIAVGQKMPAWVESGCQDYTQRLPREFRFELIEVPLGRRSGNNPDIARARREEGEKVLRHLGRDSRTVALDERGASWSSQDLAAQLAQWQLDGRDVNLLIGGPDGHDPEVMARADQRWSLSKLTLPHAMVRVLLIEQIYRAHTLNIGHPYHRE